MNAFWSVTVYNREGFFFGDAEALSINSYKAEPNADGSYTVNFSNDSRHSYNTFNKIVKLHNFHFNFLPLLY